MKTGLLATFLLLVTVPAAAPQPAPAQGWEEYSYPDYAFSVAFPANPQVDTTTYQIADNRSVPARIYSVRQANVAFSMIVAELEGTILRKMPLSTMRLKCCLKTPGLGSIFPRVSIGFTAVS